MSCDSRNSFSLTLLWLIVFVLVIIPDFFSDKNSNDKPNVKEQLISQIHKDDYSEKERLTIGNYSSELAFVGDLQKMTDKEDTSAIFLYGNNDIQKTIITDRRNQGFEILKDLDIGDKAELNDKTITLKSKYFGFHTDKNIIRNDGVDIIDIADGDIVMYTAMNDEYPTKIIITFWK